MADKVDILGVKVDRVNKKDIFSRVEQWLKDKHSHYIVTPNPEFVIAARKDKDFAHIINQADLAVADGVGLVWAAKILYGKRAGLKRITGVDLMQELIAWGQKSSAKVFLLGAGPGVADECARILEKRYPKIEIVGAYGGRAEEKYDQQVRQHILQQTKGEWIDFLFIAYGAVRQEKWIARNLPDLPVSVAMGIGGAFDFISGRVKRAPAFWQKLGLEWLWRLLLEPWRWRRQLVLPHFLWLVFRKRLGV